MALKQLTDDSDDETVAVFKPSIKANRLPPGRQAFLSITSSPFKDEIDTMLFTDRIPVKQAYEWLVEECHVNDITYATLARYTNSVRQRTVPSVIVATAQEQIQRNWDGLGRIIESGLEAMDLGAAPRPSEVLAAIKQQNDMIVKLGVGVDLESMETAKRMLTKFTEDIVLPNITEEQREKILALVLEDEDLRKWIMGES